MTVREATRRESPDGHVLYVEELRKHLGIEAAAGESSGSADTLKDGAEVLRIGHDMHGDFQKMEQDDIDLHKYFQYSGCIDTQVIIEDTDAYMGKSLSSLAFHYDLAELEIRKPGCSQKPAKVVFVGSHSAGNDAIVTLQSVLAQALDRSLKTRGRDSVGVENLSDDWLEKPLQGMNTNMILLAYDTEGVETPNYKPRIRNRTSEHGFAWVHLAELASIPPGESGRNWKPSIRARHWINQDFRNFSNRFYCIGNPNGFWPEYGKSHYYHVSEGPAPFHTLFEELSRVNAGTMKGTTTRANVPTLLEEPALEKNLSTFEQSMTFTRGKNISFRGSSPRNRGQVSISRGDSSKNSAENKGKNPEYQGNSARVTGSLHRGKHRGKSAPGRGKMTQNTSNSPASEDNLTRNNENTTYQRGKLPNSRGNAASDRGKIRSIVSSGSARRGQNMGNESIITEWWTEREVK